jgi:membrane associated rhomboid family serine protease
MRPPPPVAEVRRYPVVAGVAVLAIAVTLASWAKVDISPLYETGMIRRGELWRLVTSIFPHANALHLIFNVYWLWVFGTLVEQVYGHLKTAALILLFAFGSGALEFAFAGGGIGLSGVGYGLFGLLWILALNDPRFQDAMDRRTVELFVFWFALCIVTTVTKIMPVGNIAHGGGAILGTLTGFAITKPNRRILASSGVVAILAFGLWASTLGRPRVNLSANEGYEEWRWGYDALKKKDYQNAVRWLREAVTYRPKEPGIWDALGNAYFSVDNKSASVAAYTKAAELGDAPAAYYLGTLYARGAGGVTKDTAQAVSWYRQAGERGDSEVLNDVAWEYATSDDPAIRNPKAALILARKAVDLEKDKAVPGHLDTLAAAYYANSQYEGAVKTEQHAIDLADEKDRGRFQSRLETYQAAMRQHKGKRHVP